MIKTHYQAEKSIFKNFKSENNSSFSTVTIGSELTGHMNSGGLTSTTGDSTTGHMAGGGLTSSAQTYIITCIGDNVVMKSVGSGGSSGVASSHMNSSDMNDSHMNGSHMNGSVDSVGSEEYLLVPCGSATHGDRDMNDSSDNNPITCLLTTNVTSQPPTVTSQSPTTTTSGQSPTAATTSDGLSHFMLFTCAANGLLSLYNVNVNGVAASKNIISSTLVYHVKCGHQAIVLCMASTHVNTTRTQNTASQKSPLLLATGSADSTIRVWNGQKGFITHNLKGIFILL